MAIRKERYKNLNQTLRGIREQVIDSIDFCANELPRYSDPVEMFQDLKMRVIYKNDPDNIELLQSAQTLLTESNYHGTPGAGDCDCFSILVLACCLVNGWNDNEIILTGHKKNRAAHIYTATTVKGKRYILDLTNSFPNYERKYKFCQTLKV
jgi:hypothetical protein